MGVPRAIFTIMYCITRLRLSLAHPVSDIEKGNPDTTEELKQFIEDFKKPPKLLIDTLPDTDPVHSYAAFESSASNSHMEENENNSEDEEDDDDEQIRLKH